MRIIILIGVIIICTAIAISSVGVMTPGMNYPDEQAKLMVAIIFAPTFGYFLGLALLRLIGSKPRRRRTRRAPKPTRVTPSRPFKSRLADYTHQSESEVMTHTEYQSRMPFWMAVDYLTNVPPRSAKAIRRVLERIRSLVSKAGS